MKAIYQPALGISPSGWKRQGPPIPTVEGQNKISPCNKNVLVGKNENEYYIFIGPESDHWECLSLTDSLPNSCLVNLIDLTLACEDDNSKLVEVVSVADVDDEKRVGNSLVQIRKVRFGNKVKFLFRL